VIVPSWFGMAAAPSREVQGLIGLATLAIVILFAAGEAFGIGGHAYYLVAAGAAYLMVDLVLSFGYGITPGPRFWQSGFVPLSVIGAFLGPVYRVIAMVAPPPPRDPGM
jgi:sugar phosphate permease